MTPKLCKAGQQLRLQIDDSFPDRDRRSDGWLGDARHSARVSQHNPDEQGIVTALDIDRDLHGVRKPDTMPDLADQLRLCAKRGDKRIAYIIFNGKIASPRLGWRWRKYSGINPHYSHCHVSFNKQADSNDFFNVPLLGGKL